MYEQIPQELKTFPNWICWKSVADEKSHSKIKKIPINPHTGGGAMSNNPSTWGDFATAAAAAEKYSGIGFMFGNSPYFGVDIDDARDDLKKYQNGENSVISEFVDTLGCYAELSQSRNGIHIICRGSLPKGGRRKGKIEMYETGRFFVMTGESISEYTRVRDCTEIIKPLHEKYIGGGREPAPQREHTAVSLETADEIVRRAINGKNGDKFRRLYGGDVSGYQSQSEAELAFCNLLAFWCGCDISKMDSIFRQSGLMRDKWDEKHGAYTYGEITLNRAVHDCGTFYTTADNFSVNIGTQAKGEQLPQQPRLYTFDDTGNAQRFIDLFGESVRYCYTDKRWMWFDGRRWQCDNTGAVRRMGDKSVEEMQNEAVFYRRNADDNMIKSFEKHCKSCRSNKSKTAMLSEAQHHVPIEHREMDKHKMSLNTPGGIIDLKTGAVSPHNNKLYFTKITTAEFSNNADCPKWIEFLNDIFDGDKDLVRYIQKAVGYSLTGSTAEQCAFFLYGTGRNGKSTFLNVIRDIFGDYAANIQPETIMIRSNTSAAINSDIARLKGARLVTSVEPNEGMRINEGLVKQLTGDDTVTARKLYGEEFEFKPEFKLWMATNHKPIIRGTDEGIWRRIHMIPFSVQIPAEKIDRKLNHKLAAEMTGIFRWAVEGCLLWQAEGLGMPTRVQREIQEFRREMDTISAFIDDRCEVGKGLSVGSAQLYAVFCRWAEENHEYVFSNKKFSGELKKRFEKVHTRNGAVFIGVTAR